MSWRPARSHSRPAASAGRVGPQGSRPAGPRPPPSPARAGGAGRARRSNVAAAVDDQVAAALGRGVDPAGAPGLRPDGGPTVAAGRVQPAGQRQDAQGRPAPRPGWPVPLCQRAGQGAPGGRGAGDQRGHQEARTAGASAHGWAGVAPTGEPVEVEDHHCFFTGPDVEQAIPYGIYDLTRNTGWVNVGVDHDTSVFAVESIRRWWRARGSRNYPKASRLLITADAGGSNGYRYRVWKSWLATLAAETGPAITVCHFPPGPPRGTRSNTGCSRTSPKLAGQATDQPRGGRQDHRGDPHQQRSACRGRPGSRRLPDGRRDQQAAPGCPAA